MTMLAWFPLDADAWDRRCAELSLEEEGALFRAVRQAWRHEVPCTIGDTPAAMEKLLGSRRRQLEPFLRTQFVSSDDAPGRLVCPWLRDIWEAQHGRYTQKAEAGRAGGTAPGKKRGRKPRNSAANSAGNSSANSLAIADRRGGFTPDANASGGEDPPRDDSAPLAPEGRGAPPPRERVTAALSPEARAWYRALPTGERATLRRRVPVSPSAHRAVRLAALCGVIADAHAVSLRPATPRRAVPVEPPPGLHPDAEAELERLRQRNAAREAEPPARAGPGAHAA